MMAPPYVDGIADTVTHNIASSLLAGQIAADASTVSISVVSPDRWFIGDFAVVTSRDGRAFVGEVQDMDVCTGQVTLSGAGQLTARTTLLRGLRGRRRKRSHAVIGDHRPQAHLVVLQPDRRRPPAIPLAHRHSPSTRYTSPAVPPNFRNTRCLKLHRAYESELADQNIWQPLTLATGFFGQVLRVLNGEIGAV